MLPLAYFRRRGFSTANAVIFFQFMSVIGSLFFITQLFQIGFGYSPLAAGLRINSLPEKSYLVRPHPAGGPDQVLKIDWFGIRDRGDTLTNYQIFPGDRLIVPGGRPPGLIGSLFGG